MKYLVIILLTITNLPIFAQKGFNDFITLEALISFHKRQAKQEDAITASLISEKSLKNKLKNTSKKFKEAKKILSSKFNTITNYVTLVPLSIQIGIELKNLEEAFMNLSSPVFKHSIKNPTYLIYYSNALAKIGKEISFLTKQIASLIAGSTTGLGLYTSESLYNIMSLILGSITTCRFILNNVYYYCSYVINSGYKYYYNWEIFNEKTMTNIFNETLPICDILFK